MPFIFYLFTSCEREGYFLEFGETKIVVEGWIDEGEVARVLLSRSVPITELVDSSNFVQYAIRAALVIVSDGTIYDTLRLRSASQHLPPFLYIGERIIGQTGRTYHLRIEYIDPANPFYTQILTAETTIPPSVSIHNVEFVRQNPTDTTGSLRIDFTHPENQQIYYQIATMVLGFDEIFMPTLYGNISSQNFTSPNVQMTLMRGVSIFPRVNFDLYFKEGDDIVVRLRTMPRKSFEFWNLWQNEIINARNPIFPANTSLRSNINGGIGLWSGYGQSTVRITAR
ncbi:MAG: DUF4249 domain-containing protein [Bacteroidales bacterium]|nr:DUF4249 domain-containing protein [Bacteroidales bacterium]